MDVFNLRNTVIGDYSAYVRSFLTINDERIRRLVSKEMDGGFLWPDPLIQLNPSFEAGETLQQLIDLGELHSECINIFRDKREDGTVGAPFRLHRHQIDGIRLPPVRATVTCSPRAPVRARASRTSCRSSITCFDAAAARASRPSSSTR